MKCDSHQLDMRRLGIYDIDTSIASNGHYLLGIADFMGCPSMSMSRMSWGSFWTVRTGSSGSTTAGVLWGSMCAKYMPHSTCSKIRVSFALPLPLAPMMMPTSLPGSWTNLGDAEQHSLAANSVGQPSAGPEVFNLSQNDGMQRRVVCGNPAPGNMLLRSEQCCNWKTFVWGLRMKEAHRISGMTWRRIPRGLASLLGKELSFP